MPSKLYGYLLDCLNNNNLTQSQFLSALNEGYITDEESNIFKSYFNEHMTMTLDQLKKNKLDELDVNLKKSINSEFKSFVLGTEHTYGYSKDDQFNFMKQTLLFDKNPSETVCMWNTREGALIHSKVQFEQLLSDATAHEKVQWEKFFTLQTQVNNSITINEINNIKW